jgi:hypothetical protein
VAALVHQGEVVVDWVTGLCASVHQGVDCVVGRAVVGRAVVGAAVMGALVVEGGA